MPSSVEHTSILATSGNISLGTQGRLFQEVDLRQKYFNNNPQLSGVYYITHESGYSIFRHLECSGLALNKEVNSLWRDQPPKRQRTHLIP